MKAIIRARSELAHVQSKAFPGKALAATRVFSEEDYFNLILTEHMDPARFRSIVAGTLELDDDQFTRITRLANRILVIIGSNQEDAYRFTGNYASARGLTQFTPMGMSAVWAGYPDAGISRDFFEATSDHVSAIKAEICLLDNDLAGLAAAYPGLMGSGMEMYAAGAAYNGGPKRVRYGLQNFGLDWLKPALRLAELSGKKNRSRKETLEYRWLHSNRSHETFIYLDKIRANARSQERLALIRQPESSGLGPATPTTDQVAQ